ncbi:extracellular solute-binding protein [Paenibacillus sp. CAU 1782]
MRKKWAWFLSVVLIASLVLTACSKNGSEITDSTGNGEGAPEGSAPVTEPGTFPIVNEKITLRVMVPQYPEVIDFSTNEFTKWFEERTNIHIEWDPVPSANATEKLNLVLASGDLPDVFLGMGIGYNTEAMYGVDQQIFRPLDDLIDKYMVNFKEILSQNESLKGRMTATDGKIYALPSINDCFHCNYSQKMWINQTWLDKLNLEMPTTTDEFYNVLKAFKEQDPNGNGLADEIPLAGATDGWRTNVDSFIMNAFAYDTGMWNPLKTYMSGQTVSTIVDSEGYKEGLAYLNKLYKEGLIYQPSFTQKNDQLKGIANNPDASILGAVPVGGHNALIDAVNNEERYREFQALPPLKGPGGVQQVPYFEYDGAQTGDFLISAKSKYPEAAIRLADDLYLFETQQRMAIGIKGEQWDDADAGQVGLDGKPALFKRLRPYSNEPQNYGWMFMGIENAPAEWRLGEATNADVDMYSQEGLEKLLYEVSDKVYKPYTPSKEETSVLPPIRLLSEENEAIQTIRVELENYISESRVRFIIGDLNLTTDWDAYVDSLKKIGLDTLLETYQKGFDRQYK